MSNRRLKYLNPFYFDKRVVLLAVWLNLILTVLLLGVAGILALRGAPAFATLSSRMVISPTRLDQEWNVAKLRQMVIQGVSYQREELRHLADALNGLALACGALAVFLFLNAYYFYRADQLLDEVPEADSEAAP